MELTNDEKLALATVLEKRLKELLSDLKGGEKDELFRLHDEYGVDRRAIEVGGSKVGTTSLTYTKEKIDIKPGQELRALRYLDSCGLTETVPAKDWQSSFSIKDNGDIICLETGEIANELFTVYPSVPKTTMVKVDQEKAVKALRPLIEGYNVSYLLEA